MPAHRSSSGVVLVPRKPSAYSLVKTTPRPNPCQPPRQSRSVRLSPLTQRRYPNKTEYGNCHRVETSRSAASYGKLGSRKNARGLPGDHSTKRPLPPVSLLAVNTKKKVNPNLIKSKHISLEEFHPVRFLSQKSRPSYIVDSSVFLAANAPPGVQYVKEKNDQILLQPACHKRGDARQRQPADALQAGCTFPRVSITKNNTIILPTLAFENEVDLDVQTTLNTKIPTSNTYPQFGPDLNAPDESYDPSEANGNGVILNDLATTREQAFGRYDTSTSTRMQNMFDSVHGTQLLGRRNYSLAAICIGEDVDLSCNKAHSRIKNVSLSERNKAKAVSMRKGSLRLSSSFEPAPRSIEDSPSRLASNMYSYNLPMNPSWHIHNTSSRMGAGVAQISRDYSKQSGHLLSEHDVLSQANIRMIRDLHLGSDGEVVTYPAQPPPTEATQRYPSREELDFKSLVDQKRRSMSRYAESLTELCGPVTDSVTSRKIQRGSLSSHNSKPVIIVPSITDDSAQKAPGAPMPRISTGETTSAPDPAVNIQMNIDESSPLVTRNGSKSSSCRSSGSSSLLPIEPLDNEGIASLPASPRGTKHFFNRRSSSIDSGLSRPGSELLVPLITFNPRDRVPTGTESPQESPAVSPTYSTMSEDNLPQQVVHRVTNGPVYIPPTPCQSPDEGVQIQAPIVQIIPNPQVSLTTDDGDDFAVWFGRRGSIFIEDKSTEEKGQQQCQVTTTSQQPGQTSLLVPKFYHP